jgi:plastocyanin
MEGVAKGTATTRYGFEYSIPITLRRYLASRSDSSASRTPPPSDEHAIQAEGQVGGPSADSSPPVGRDTVVIDVKSLTFGRRQRVEVTAGTVVLWRNHDPLTHVVAADDKSFESPPIDPAASWAKRFDDAGTYNYHCIPHPFMMGTIVVK